VKSILIVGCGAIGGLFATSLAKVADVVAFDANREHVNAINALGLRLTGQHPARVDITATADADELAGRHFDAVFFLVKSKATGPALQQLKSVLAHQPMLVTLQNGMGNAEVLLSAKDCAVVRGVTMQAGRYVKPGTIEKLIEGPTWLGPVRARLDDIKPLADLLTRAGEPTEVLADPMGAVWSKFVFNCVMNPLGALMMGDNAARHDSAAMRTLVDDMADECVAVVGALGGTFAFPPMDFVAKIRRGELPVSPHAGSMALDIARGIPTEIDELTGFIVREGDRLGIPVPNCRVVYRLIRGLESASRRRIVKMR
jgi:2-dehydropantoate 2-reductase